MREVRLLQWLPGGPPKANRRWNFLARRRKLEPLQPEPLVRALRLHLGSHPLLVRALMPRPGSRRLLVRALVPYFERRQLRVRALKPHLVEIRDSKKSR